MRMPRRSARHILDDSYALAYPALRSAVEEFPEAIQHPVGVHFGWWDRAGNALRSNPGKSLRSALVILSCQALGGSIRQALPAALAVEMVHNASLLHDDIIDNDRLRRGRASLWSAMGVPAAILAGDALFFGSLHALTGAPHADRTVPVFLAAVQNLIEGEYVDTLMEKDTTATLDDALDMIAGKTAELLSCACTLGAILSGAEDERVQHLSRFGLLLGVAFQCTDDVLGIWGDPEATGKPARSDLRSRKLSVPIALALNENGPPAERLRALYRREAPPTEAESRVIADELERHGVRGAVVDLARENAGEALAALHSCDPDPVTSEELAELTKMILQRSS
ncbi:polyprenyl synthetase family protein [Streptomyces niveus]|uniref:Polyprenyl synthetase family protein n=1 Tax=Streptomyces niveus TaxID=193462 RepID=A0ABZ2A1M9_STRNV|nr:polyprenyl synthetase family protein [Streptomyces niveus]